MVIETGEKDMDAIEIAIHTLCELNESVVLVYGRDVKLRTSNKNVDLAKIAQKFGGGGHAFAAACNVKGKLAEFKEFISRIR